jgi:predicted metalloprotease with PDZ domain
MVCKADTASFKISGIEFRISVYNEQNKLLAGEFAKKMMPGLEAALLFFNNNLPLESYDFLFYIKDFSELDRFIRKADNFDSETVDKVIEIYEQYNNYEQSALEHRNSSLFCMQADYDDQCEFMMLDYVIHEFIHIITPKAISSRLIKEFDFADPELSQHRWLYEGVTEYFSGLIKLRADLISTEFYLHALLNEKLAISATYPTDMPFTEFSKYTNIYPYKAHYHQSYYHGPVLALMLDLEIIKLTGGEKDLKEVVIDLLRQDKILTEDNLIPEFVRLVDPRLQEFFDRHISGIEKLPLKEAFNSVGISYCEEMPVEVPDISFSAFPLFNFYLIS